MVDNTLVSKHDPNTYPHIHVSMIHQHHCEDKARRRRKDLSYPRVCVRACIRACVRTTNLAPCVLLTQKPGSHRTLFAPAKTGPKPCNLVQPCATLCNNTTGQLPDNVQLCTATLCNTLALRPATLCNLPLTASISQVHAQLPASSSWLLSLHPCAPTMCNHVQHTHV